MDNNVLQTILVVFMLFLCLLCLFAVVVIVRDLIVESIRSRKQGREDQPVAAAVQPTIVVQPAPVVTTVAPAPKVEPKDEPKVELKVEPNEEACADVENDDENEVAFSRTGLTIEEKFAQLPSELKVYFNELVRHVLSKDGVKENKHPNSYDYKDASYKVLRLSIKRNEIVCDVFFMDRELLSYAKETGVKVKQPPTKIRVVDADTLAVAKDGIDRVIKQIVEDKERKKELAREKRRERRKAAVSESGEQEQENNE